MPLHVALYEPEIPWNTGNIGRTCVATGSTLHLIGRLGFDLSQKEIRRSGMDYWPRLSLKRHENLAAFESELPKNARVLVFSTRGKKTLWEAPFCRDSYLLFGRESSGLPEAVHKRYAESIYRIPMLEEARSLNLSTAVAVALYEGWRQTRE